MSQRHQRVLTRDDGNSIASTHLDSVGDAANEFEPQVDDNAVHESTDAQHAAITATSRIGHDCLNSDSEGNPSAPYTEHPSPSPASPPQRVYINTAY